MLELKEKKHIFLKADNGPLLWESERDGVHDVVLGEYVYP